MNKNFQNIFDEAEQVILSSDEKKKMRENLGIFIEQHPVRNADISRHLLREESKTHISAFAGIFTLKPLIHKLQYMIIALIIALLIGGGTSFAAESALPGDILYPIKVSINEEVRSAVTISDEAQAQWDARRAERRLEEAEKLAAQGRLNAQTRADIESRFETFAQAFQKRVEKIEAKQKTNAAFELHSNFEASLKAHEKILEQLGEEKENMKTEIQPILVKMRVRLNTEIKARSDADAKVSAETSADFKSAAEGKLKAAENKIAEVRGFISKITSSVNANVAVEAETKLKASEEIVANNKVKMGAGAYGEAFTGFQEAIRVAQEAQLIAATENKLKIEIKAPGLDIRANENAAINSGNQANDNPGISGSASTTGKIKSGAEVDSGDDSIGLKGEGEIKLNTNTGL